MLALVFGFPSLRSINFNTALKSNHKITYSLVQAFLTPHDFISALLIQHIYVDPCVEIILYYNKLIGKKYWFIRCHTIHFNFPHLSTERQRERVRELLFTLSRFICNYLIYVSARKAYIVVRRFRWLEMPTKD